MGSEWAPSGQRVGNERAAIGQRMYSEWAESGQQMSSEWAPSQQLWHPLAAAGNYLRLQNWGANHTLRPQHGHS